MVTPTQPLRSGTKSQHLANLDNSLLGISDWFLVMNKESCDGEPIAVKRGIQEYERHEGMGKSVGG